MSLHVTHKLANDDIYGTGTTPHTVVSREALRFVEALHKRFDATRLKLLNDRAKRQAELESTPISLSFSTETQHIREDDSWKGPSFGPGLEDRRVEITGPPERNMIVHALNSAAKVYMSDFEDSLAPTWANLTWGQANLYDAVRGKADFKDHKTGKDYKVVHNDRQLPVLMVRPRGWHLPEKHVLVGGEPVSASLFDFGIFFHQNAKQLVANGFAPYFYLPKLESYHEARLWADVFSFSEEQLGIKHGTIRATVLIETLPAAFQMDEIIYELRDYSAGLNCGRWDYIFSTIKTLKASQDHILPDRDEITMKTPFMHAYSEKLIEVCHRRGVHAMGGMTALIPVKNDARADERAHETVKEDKLREVTLGHDGTWVAHPSLVGIANDVFNQHMLGPNQIAFHPDHEANHVSVTGADLLNTYIPGGTVTTAGIKKNINVALRYVEAWLRGIGCVTIDHCMEDAATAEVSRAQLYQWVRHAVVTSDKEEVLTKAMVQVILENEARMLEQSSKTGSQFHLAKEFLLPEVMSEQFSDFITLPLYDKLLELEKE